MMRAGLRMAMVLALAGLFVGCALLPAKPANVMGTVTYRERSALPADALVEVTLYDVTQADAPAQVVASQTIPLNGRQVPVAFDLVVQPGWLQAKGSYVLRARILMHRGKVLFSTDKDYPIRLSKRPPELELVVKPVKQGTPR